MSNPAKFVGGPWAGRYLDPGAVNLVAHVTSLPAVATAPTGLRLFLIMPPVALGERVMLGELSKDDALPLYDGGGSIYERVWVVPLRAAEFHHRPEGLPKPGG